MRLAVSVLTVLFCLIGGPAHAATRVGALGVTAVVVDRCVTLQAPEKALQVRCDRGVPYRTEQQPIAHPQNPEVRVMGTVITY